MQTFYNAPAGVMPVDKRANLFACKETKKVYFLKKGETKKFQDLKPEYKRQILLRLMNDPCAFKDLGQLGYTKALEKYAKCMFGSLDSTGDFCADGKLGSSSNYRCSDNCQCLFWKSKKINIGKEEFTPRQLEVLELIAQGLSDKQIADKLNVSIHNISDHKRRLQKKLNTYCKTSTAVKAIKERLVR